MQATRSKVSLVGSRAVVLIAAIALPLLAGAAVDEPQPDANRFVLHLPPVSDGFSLYLDSARFTPPVPDSNPPFDGKEVDRGTLPLGRGVGASFDFAWVLSDQKLYVDANRNGDFTDDPGSPYISSRSGRYQWFESVRVPIPHGDRITEYVVDVNIYAMGGSNAHCSVTLASGWGGPIELHGKPCRLFVADNCNGEWGQDDRFHLTAVGGEPPESVPQLANQEPFVPPKTVFFEEHLYDVDLAFDDDGVTATLTEKEADLGEIRVEGESISRVTLATHGAVHGEELVLVYDSPSGVVRAPVGDYAIQHVFLDRGFHADAHGLWASNRKWDALVNVKEDRPAVLRTGCPLHSAVHVVRRGTTLDLSYQLVGLGGEVYTGGSLYSAKPRFTAYWGPLRIGSAQFQFG